MTLISNKTMKQFCIFLFFSFLFQACKVQDTLELELKEPKLILNAILIANENPSVYVGKAFAPTGKIPIDHFISDASVVLYENDKPIGTLLHQKNGVYTLVNYPLKVGKFYQFKVKVLGYTNVQNVPVLIPSNIETNSVSFDNTTDYPTLSTNGRGRLLSVILQDSLKGEFYGLAFKSSKNSFSVNGNRYPIEVGTTSLNKLNTDCYKWLAISDNVDYSLTRESFTSVILYNASCFGKQKKMGIVIDTYGTVQTRDKDGNLYNSQIDRLEALIFTFSEEYFIYSKNIKVLQGIDNAFFEPQRVYSNVVNGYGVVVAMNKKVVVFNF